MPKLIPAAPTPPGKPLRPNMDLPVEVTRIRDDVVRHASQMQTASEAVDAAFRSQAKAAWTMGVSIADLSKIFGVTPARLREWQAVDSWPAKSEVKAMVGDSHRERTRRVREAMQTEHLEKQNKLMNNSYELLKKASDNVHTAKDPVAAAANLVKAGATLGKHFIDISGLNAPEEKKAPGKQALNLFLLTGDHKAVAVSGTTTPAPYGEGED